MTNELYQTGVGNLAVQDVSNSTINVTQIIGKSSEYHDLLNQLTKAEKYFSRLLESETAERLEAGSEISQLKNKIEQFKKDVLKLAETFERIDVNTERLKRAKAYFDDGEIAEARAVLESKLEQMNDEQQRLLERRAEFEAEILPKLRNNSQEFLMLALLTAANYEKPSRFVEAEKYFERSLESLETKENLFQYSSYLLVVNQTAKAERQFERLQRKFGDELEDADKIGVYINLAFMYVQENKFAYVETAASNALELLKREESAALPSYKSNLANTYIKLGVAYKYQFKFPEAENAYAEAEKIYYEIKNENFLEYAANIVNLHSGFAMTLMTRNKFPESHAQFEKALAIINGLEVAHGAILPAPAVNLLCNLGILYTVEEDYEKARETLQNALGFIEQMPAGNPQLSLSNKARILNALGDTWARDGKFIEAQKIYEPALAIMLEFVAQDPELHVVLYAILVANLSECYSKTEENRDISIQFAVEAIVIILPRLESLPYLQVHYQKSLNALKTWNFSEEEIYEMITAKVNQR